MLQPRRFQLYGLGAPKSGTHSVARLFEGQYRARHEAHPALSVDLLVRRRWGMPRQQLRSELLVRDVRVWAECESASYLAWFADELPSLFPSAKFLVPVRDCRSWVDAVLDQHQNVVSREPFSTLRRIYLGDAPTEPGNSGLAAFCEPPLENFVAYWRDHHDFLLRHLDDERTLWVSLPELSTVRPRLQQLLGVPLSNVDREAAHAYRAPVKHHILSTLDVDVAGIIRELATETAAALVDRVGGDAEELLGI